MEKERSAAAVAAVPAGQPFLPFHKPSIGEEEIAAVVDTLRSGWLTMGPKTRAFEETFAERIGVANAVAVSSATAGLHLGLDALGIGEGDEVLVPTLTFASTAATVVHTGARPVLVDCEPDTLDFSVADAIRKWTPRTKAMVPVHFGGHPCDMDAILALAAERQVPVMEDAAHALPARHRGRMIGTLSTLTVFSFYATKNLATGEGGMVVGDAELLDRIRGRRLHGMTRDAWKRYSKDGSWRYDVAYPGFKYNMTDMNAALGLVQLQRLDAMQARRAEIIAQYQEALAEVDELLELPTVYPDIDHAWHLFAVRVRPERLRIGRDEVIQELTAAGIGTSVHFIPLHEHSYYRDVLGVRASELPVATREWQRVISLPLYPDLTDDDVERVADSLRGILRRHRR
ncbi:MAG TPA: DegT/DnrJ/EryC1/StrS aminotransferase family protein [Candidatus Dormibacteraeota bacterium]|nr:DegT/DnrJ/EryC1/StrS aminotransferase family protein [Candidatus Dormibacteraeota bacterium]